MSEIQLMHYKQKTPEETVQFLQDILKNMKVEVTETWQERSSIGKNQMSVGPITAPVSMIIGLLPMFSAMNSELEKIAKGIYSYYVRQMFVTWELENSVNSWLILLINFLVLSLVFAIFYRIKGLNNE